MTGSTGHEGSESDRGSQSSDEEECWDVLAMDPEDEDSASVAAGQKTDADDSSSDGNGNVAINTRIRRQFLQHLDQVKDECRPLRKDEIRGIKLMSHLHKKNVALNACPEIMEWHLKQVGLL